MRLASPSADRILEKRRQDWEKTHPILLGQERSLARLFRHYVQGGGSQADHVLKALQAKMDEVAAQQGFRQSEESIFDQYGRILPECLRQVCPEYIDAYFDVGPQDCVETHELLAAGRNEHHDESLPLPLNMVLHRKLRPALNVYGTTKAALFVSPTAYQLCNIEENWFWPSASSRTL